MFELTPFDRRDRNLFDPFDWFNDRFFQETDRALVSCRTDILDKGDHFLVQAELPGFAKEDIHLDIHDNLLTLHAEHQEEEKKEEGSYVRRERRYGGFSRSFDISGIDAEKISASYENGVLELQLPKKDAAKPQPRKIEIK